MKPLRGDSPTGYWRYDGTPVTAEDQKYYESRGVTFKAHPDGDLMPDGRRLRPKRLRSDAKYDMKKAGTTCRTVRPVMEEAEFWEMVKGWRKEYEDIDADKPPFVEWIAARGREHAELTLLFNSLVSGRASQSSKAAAAYLEFTKAKPKASVEVSTPQAEVAEMSAMELLKVALDAMGADEKKTEQIMRLAIPSQVLN